MQQQTLKSTWDFWQTPISEAVSRALNSLRAVEPLKCSDFADRFFYLSAESSNVEGAWITRPSQRAILNAMGNDDIEIVTEMKPKRMGFTKMTMATISYFIKHKKRSGVFYQPTDTDSDDFVKDEIDPMIRDVPEVAKALQGDPEKRSSENNLSKKVFFGAIWDFKGGKTPRNYRRMTKDVAMYDELDGFDRDIGKEGSPTSLGDGRIEGAAFPKSIRGSTPRIKGISLIEESFQSADIQLRRALPCPHCGKHQILVWRGMKWDEKDYQTTRYECQFCLGKIYYKDFFEMDEEGIWVTHAFDKESGYFEIPEDYYWIDEHEDVLRQAPDNEKIEWPIHVGFHIWGAYSYQISWPKAARNFINATTELKKTGNVEQLKTFVNTYLAETWEEDQGDRPDWEDLKNRAENYEIRTIPKDGLLLVLGVDTQNDRLPYVLVAYGPGEESWRIDYGEIFGDPQYQDPWEQLDQILQMQFKHESGAMMRITACGIDSGGLRTQAVYNYCRSRAPLVMATKGMSTPNKPVLGKPTTQDVTWEGITYQEGVQLWPIGPDTAKAAIYARMAKKEPGAGYFHTPIGFPDQYYQQVTAEKLVTKFKKGVPVQEWIAESQNHAIDCEVNAYAAAIRAGLHYINWDDLRSHYEKHPHDAQEIAAKPQRTRMLNRGIRR